MTALLIAIFVVLSADHWIARTEFAGPPAKIMTAGITPSGTVAQVTGIVNASRAWEVKTPARGAALFLFARGSQSAANGGWEAVQASKGTQLSPSGSPETTIVVPSGGNATLARFVVPGPDAINGRRFRVQFLASITKRLGSPDPVLSLSDQHGQHKQSWPIRSDGGWAPVEATWTVPAAAQGDGLTVTISRLGGTKMSLRGFRLEEYRGDAWRQVSDTSHVIVSISQPDRNDGGLVTHEFAIRLKPDWQAYTLPAGNLNPGTIEVRITAGTGVTAQLKDLRFRVAQGSAVRPIPASNRASIAHLPPNLVGHSLASIFLLVLATAQTLPLIVAGGAAAVAGAWLTGSRAALLGIFAGSILFAKSRRPRTATLSLLTVLALATGAYAWLGAAPLQRSDAKVDATRPEIWSTALRAVRLYPLRGLPEDFASFWESQHPGTTPVQHAHNVWLEFAAQYGLPGLAAILWLTGGFVTLAWRWGGWRGLSLVIPILLLNAFDYTLFFAGVLYPLILGCNALPSLESPPRTGERRARALDTGTSRRRNL